MRASRTLIAIGLVAGAGALSGCASTFGVGSDQYSCDGYPEGVQCKSASEVYEATEHGRSVSDESQETDPELFDEDRGKEPDRASPEAPESALPAASGVAPVARLEGKTPIRTEAQVMRIWVNSWEDERGDLHLPGLVYTEVEERRWNVGERKPQGGSQIRRPGQASMPE